MQEDRIHGRTLRPVSIWANGDVIGRDESEQTDDVCTDLPTALPFEEIDTHRWQPMSQMENDA